MRNNDQSNRIIKWIVTVGDFALLNAILLGFAHWHWRMGTWQMGRVEIFILVNNIALMLAMLKFSTIIHLRVIGAGEILKRMVGMTVVQTVLAYLLLKVFAYNTPIGWLLWEIGTVFFIGLLFKRLGERWFLKLYREAGRNTRSVTLVGSDPELIGIFMKLRDDATLGYRILGYYGEASLGGSDGGGPVDEASSEGTGHAEAAGLDGGLPEGDGGDASRAEPGRRAVSLYLTEGAGHHPEGIEAL